MLVQILKRREAKAIGLKFYICKPCCNGHWTKRYVSNGKCVDCLHIPEIMERRKELNRLRWPNYVKRHQERANKLYRTNPTYRMGRLLRTRVNYALRGKGKKCATTVALLGISLEGAKTHIENQFKNGMSWSNAGEWHIDHIIPCASFDLSDPEQQKKCFHYTNLQPLWGKDNQKKGKKVLIGV